jgi:hypothetical protein
MRRQISFFLIALCYCICSVAGFQTKATTSCRSLGRRDSTSTTHRRSSVAISDALRVTNSRRREHGLSKAIAMSTNGAGDSIANAPAVANQNLYRPMKIMGEKKKKKHLLCIMCSPLTTHLPKLDSFTGSHLVIKCLLY